MMNYDKLLSRAVREIKPSGIRKFFDIAATMEGVISLSVGEPDFKTPWRIRRRAILELEKGRTRYTGNAGVNELKDEISRYTESLVGVKYNPADEIIVTVGGSEAIDLAVRTLINRGDEVVVPEPSFVCYSPLVSMAGGVPVPLVTKAADKFKITPQSLKGLITPKTKALLLPFPNNPTGAVMRREELSQIAELLAGTDIFVIADEIYAELTYGGEKHCSIASLPGMRERTVIVNGFSKAFSMTGWRLGWLAAPGEILSQTLKIHQYGIMCAPTVSQYAAITALTECRDDVAYMTEEYDERRKLCVKNFNDLGLPCFTPEGAFYVFPDITPTGLTSDEFCARLLTEKQVACVPGGAFGESGEGFVRVSYAYSLAHLTEAFQRMSDFIAELKQS